MIENDYPLGFKVTLHRKDLGIALELAAGDRREPAGRPSWQRTLEDDLVAGGHGDDDMSALARSIRARSGLRRTELAEPDADPDRASRRRSSIGSPSLPSYRGRKRSVSYISATSTRRGPRPGAGQRRVRVLAVLDRDHPPGDAVADQVHRDVRERHRDHRVERVRLAAAEVVGQLRRDRLDPGPGLDLGGQRLADVRLVAVAEHVGLADVGRSGRPPRSRPRR